MTGARRSTPVALLAVLVAACQDHPPVTADAPPTDEGIFVTDSSGVRVIAYGALHEDHFPRVRLLEGVDTIGVDFGEEAYHFSHIRGAVVTDESIVVADQLSREIRMFDGEGRFVTGLGAEGEGPGEFEAISWIQGGLDGNLFVWDGQGYRLTSIAVGGDSALTVLSSRRLSIVPWEAQPMGVLTDGRIMLVGSGPDRASPSLGKVNGGEMLVGLANAEMLPKMDRLGTVPSQPVYFSNDSRIVRVPFTVLPDYYAIGLDDVWIGSGTRREIRKFDLDGRLRVVLRLPPQGAVTDRDIEEFIRMDLAAYPENERPLRRNLLSEIPMPNELPAFDRIILDGRGRLWVGAFNSASSAAVPWHGFDQHGCPVGRVVPPAGVHMLAVGRNRIAGEVRDDLGVPRLVVFRFLEPSPADSARVDCSG